MIEKIKELVQPHGKLLYLTEFGSVLYGTNSESSDIDYKGIFLPCQQDMLLGKAAKNIHYTTGDSHSRNTKDDIDVGLWSLQYFMELIGKGDTNAIDLLFSMYSSHNEKYFDNQFFSCMTAPDIVPADFIDIKNTKSYISYAYAQAKKYGLKGSRLAKLKEIIMYLDHKCPDPIDRIGDYFKDIIDRFGDESLCFIKTVKIDKNSDEFVDMLYITGKGFDPHIRVKEALSRLHTDYNRYGERAKEAEQNKNIDWKAISHAVRCLFQMIELIDTGMIHYPLKDAEFIKEIKYGKRTWKECEQIIVDMLKIVDEKAKTVPANKTFKQLHEDLILTQYSNEETFKPEL